MRLIQSETVFYDYTKDSAESIKTIVHETSGKHHIREGLRWFLNSNFDRVKLEPSDDTDYRDFYRSVYICVISMPFKRTLRLRQKHGVITLYREKG